MIFLKIHIIIKLEEMYLKRKDPRRGLLSRKEVIDAASIFKPIFYTPDGLEEPTRIGLGRM